MLTLDLRRRAIDFFKVPLANMYGSEEMNCIAYEYPDTHMNILDDNVFVEVMNRNGINQYGEGEAIITNLNNVAMPLVRYNQGDLINVGNENVNKDKKVIFNILGRKLQEVTIGTSSISAFAFSEVIAVINNKFDDIILNYQFIYTKTSGRLLCKLVLDDARNNWFPNVRNAIIDVLNTRFNIIMCNNDVIHVTNLENIVGLKHRAIKIEE